MCYWLFVFSRVLNAVWPNRTIWQKSTTSEVNGWNWKNWKRWLIWPSGNGLWLLLNHWVGFHVGIGQIWSQHLPVWRRRQVCQCVIKGRLGVGATCTCHVCLRICMSLSYHFLTCLLCPSVDTHICIQWKYYESKEFQCNCLNTTTSLNLWLKGSHCYVYLTMEIGHNNNSLCWCHLTSLILPVFVCVTVCLHPDWLFVSVCLVSVSSSLCRLNWWLLKTAAVALMYCCISQYTGILGRLGCTP